MTSKQRAYLKGLAMKMEPIMQLGKGSVTPENTVAVDEALAARELIKISVLQNCLDDPRQMAEVLAERTHADVVQVIGKKIVHRQQKGLEYRHVQRINDRLRPLLRIDQPRAFQYGQVMGYRRFRQIEAFRYLSRAQIFPLQHREDFPPGFIAHRFPHVSHGFIFLLFVYLDNYLNTNLSYHRRGEVVKRLEQNFLNSPSERERGGRKESEETEKVFCR